MSNDELAEELGAKALEIIRGDAPVDTGNLKYNATKMVKPGDCQRMVYVDTGNGLPLKQKVKGIAPYMKYTNESWNLFQPPLKGKKNPNEGWWNNAFNKVIAMVQNEFGFKVKEL